MRECPAAKVYYCQSVLLQECPAARVSCCQSVLLRECPAIECPAEKCPAVECLDGDSYKKKGQMMKYATQITILHYACWGRLGSLGLLLLTWLYISIHASLHV